MRSRAIIIAGALAMLVCADRADAKLEILVEKASQRMMVMQDGYIRYIWPVSTGRDSLETPNGTYTPQRLERNWFSSAYYNSPMPYSIFFHNGYAIHGSYAINQLGGPASHGCVRLHPHHAALLFDLVQREGPGNTTIDVTDEPLRPEMLRTSARESEQARETSSVGPRPGRFGEFGDTAELNGGPRAIRPVNMRPPLPLPMPSGYPPANRRQLTNLVEPDTLPPSLREGEQARETSSVVSRPGRSGEFGDMAELNGGPRAIRPVNMRPPLPLPPGYPPTNRRQLTNLVEPAKPPRGPCVIRADSTDCRPRPKPAEAAPRERVAAALPAQPVPSPQQAPSVAGFKVLPATCWSGGASRWQWWRSGQTGPCR
jgi:L,D-transpeptidase-like protein